MRTPTLTSGVLIALFALSACDSGKKDEATKTDAAEPGKDGEAAAAEGGEADAPAEAAALSFEESLEKEECEVLTAALVGETFGLAAGDLKQSTIAGCIYQWESEAEELNARLGSFRVHDDVDKAKQWFENSTKDMSQEEIAAAMGKIKAKAAEDGKLDTKAKDEAADEIGGAITEMAGADGYTFETIDGVGDAAAVSGDDGQVTVLLGNATFTVSAYKGKKQPPIQMPANPRQIAEVAKKENAKWMVETLDQRKTQSTALAKAVVETLRKRG